MRYTLLKMTVAATLLIYFFMGFYTKSAPGGEKYPFFSWSLFNGIPNSIEEYSIAIVSIGDRTYSPPLPSWETGFLFEPLNQAPTQYHATVQELGRAVQENREEDATFFRKKLEAIFPDKRFEYEVYKMTYDPVRFWKTREYETREKVASFKNS